MMPAVTAHRVHVSTCRTVTLDVADRPPLLTPAGTRPLDPIRIEINYHIGARKIDRIWVVVTGEKLFTESGIRRRRPHQKAVSARSFSSVDDLPDWARQLVDEHRPIVERGWWRCPEPA